jgi:hypothetical protein
MDITIKGIPDAIGENKVIEWVGVLIERYENEKANNIPEVKAAVIAAQASIDSFRKANTLQAKSEKAPVAEPVEEPVKG